MENKELETKSEVNEAEVSDSKKESSHHSGHHHHHHHHHHHSEHHSDRHKHKSSSKKRRNPLKKIKLSNSAKLVWTPALLIAAFLITYGTVYFLTRAVDLDDGYQQTSRTDFDNDESNSKVELFKPTPIKEWDIPVYDANIPVFTLSSEKNAMNDAPYTLEDIYSKYDELMAKHPKYITKIDLGLCSDGINHVYRYDFREPEPHHKGKLVWSETKSKAIIVTGIHHEWAGIYAMYNALEEIANNPELLDLRRNTHLIVIPVVNPYAVITKNYKDSQGVRNANGVEIHRNFEIEWELTEEGSKHYGGKKPLSEVETQYIDNVLKENTDAAFFLTCHSCGVDANWGTSFIWASPATKYMCNISYRLIDKMSISWMDTYGDILSVGIEEYKTELLVDGDTRLGWAALSNTPGTETKQATKYGIQANNVEVCNPFQIHGTKENPEPTMSSFTMSRGTEVYVNFLLTAFGVYEPMHKLLYSPN